MAEGEQAPKVCPTCGNVLGMQKELSIPNSQRRGENVYEPFPQVW
jgi:hypothetical protein